MEQRKRVSIGIDLGTAYTRVAMFNGSQWNMITDEFGLPATPSYVAFTDAGVLVGQAARIQASQNPTNTVFDIIRLIGRRHSDPSVQNDKRFWPFKVVAGRDESLQVEVDWKGKLWHFTPVEICSMLLTKIKENAERTINGHTITDAAVTVPVHFNYEQRQDIKKAGMIAGLNIMQIISSPAACALFYGMDKLVKSTNVVANIKANFKRTVFGPEKYNIVIIDLGAATLDVAVATIKDGMCKVQATAGDVHLGGTDFDNNLVDYFVSSLKQRGRGDISYIPLAISNLRTLCENAKISLSSGCIMVPMMITPLYDDFNFESSITEAKFVELNNDLFLKCMRIVESCLIDASISTDTVDEIILAGSSTRIPMIKYYMECLFPGKALTISSQYLEIATAYGVASQAFFLSRGDTWRGHRLSLEDATPFGLGLRESQGPVLVYVPKNTNIPFKFEKTIRSSRKQCLVEVYEGDASMVYQNNVLGKIELSGAYVSPNWYNICFEMHKNSTLKFSVQDISTGMWKVLPFANKNIEGSEKRVWAALHYMESENSKIKASATQSLTRSGTSSNWDRMKGKRNLDKILSMDKERSEKIRQLESNRKHEVPEEYAIGIDFGTIYSSVAVWQQNGVKIIENEYGRRLTSSAVAFAETGRLIGDTVNKEQVTNNPANTIPNIKRLIGRYWSDQSVHNDCKFLPFKVISGNKNRSMVSVHCKNEDKHFTPEEIAAMILSKLKEIAEAHLNSKVSKAVISVPASFNDSQRKAIKDAALIARLDVLQLLNETTAAAIGYFLQKVSGQSSGEKTLLVFDLGGGNLHVSIVAIKEGTIRVQAVAGDTNLGGEDFDNHMLSHFVQKLKEKKKRDIHNKPRSLRRLRAACEKAKRDLSTNAQTVLEVDALDEGIDFRSVITRKEFEEFNDGLFKRSINCVKRCLEDAMIDKSSIDEVVLVGGSTRIPKMQQLLQEFFDGKEVSNSINADEAVAYGAAIQAAILSGSEEKEKFNISEVQDVSTRSFLLDNRDGATINLLIPKHTPIPAKKELIFFSCLDNLLSFSIQVKECDLASTMVFSVSGITPKPRGNSQINLSFEVDDSGILNLTAKDTSDRAENEIKISKENGGLTTEEIQKMEEDAAHYKAEDEEHKVRAVASNYLENLAYKMIAIARDPGVSAASKKSMEKAAYDAVAFLETSCDVAIDEIDAWTKKLEVISSQIVYLGTNAGS